MAETAASLPVGTRIRIHHLEMVKASDACWTAHRVTRNGLRLVADDAHGRTRPHWVAQWWLDHRPERCQITIPEGASV